MYFSRKNGALALLLATLLCLTACRTGNRVMDDQTAHRLNNMDRTWAIAVEQEQIRPAKMQKTFDLASRELEKRQERFQNLQFSWMIWFVFI